MSEYEDIPDIIVITFFYFRLFWKKMWINKKHEKKFWNCLPQKTN